MRKMISGADQEALKKLKNNIVINDNGTIVEVGGNVAVESIEQIGTIEEKNVFLCSYSQIGAALENELMFTGVEEFLSGMDIFEQDLSAYLNDGEVKNLPISEEIDGVYARIGNTYYQGTRDKKFTAVGNVQKAPTSSYMEETIENIGAQKIYKSFFTEEQYEAILDLIA